MAKHLLLGGKFHKPAAALLFFALLPIGSATLALAEGEESKADKPVSESAAPADGGKANGAPASPPAKTDVEARPEGTADTKPEDAKKSGSKTSETLKPGNAAASVATDAGSPEKDLKTGSQPTNGKPAEDGTAAGVPPKDTKSADPKAAQESPPAGQTRDSKAEVKPAAPAKPAEAKDAAASAKPKDLSPKTDTSESLSVQASSVNAVYHINWLGAYIGDFKIRSSITNRQYTLQANADISVFFGAVSWQGVTSSHGLMTANGPVPQSYSFRYSTSDRHEAIELRFQQRMVSDIIINPPQHPGSRNVPITAADLQNVVDPLSSIILLSQARLSRHNGEACNKRLPIFDGKIRYDLVLSPKGTRTISPMGRLHGIAYVCRVNYVPIAGHKPAKQGNDYATGNTGIEVWLVPLPEAGLLVPYYVHVPTPAGTASIVTTRFDVETPGGRHALAD